MGAGKDGPTRTTGNRVRTNSMCKSSLEDVMQNFSKVFKDAGKVRIRRRRSPDVAALRTLVSETLEDGSVLEIAPADILAALKKLSAALATAETEVASEGLVGKHAGQWQAMEKAVVEPYENLAGLMRTAGYHVPQVRNFKLARSIFHMLNSLAVVVSRLCVIERFK